MTPAQADKLHRRYVRARRKWAREIGYPIKGHETEPPPGEVDAEDPENG